MNTASNVLKQLQEGNQRFVENQSMHNQKACDDLVAGQNPSAVILGCADSRVPPELIFDQGLGDLFVIRVAGNVVTPTQLGSIEYAVEHLGTEVVVVLGHSGCGAVKATLDVIRENTEGLSANLCSIIEHIRPAVEPFVGGKNEVLGKAVRANVLASVEQLTEKSSVLKKYLEGHKLLIVGAEYDLKTGSVSFY